MRDLTFDELEQVSGGGISEPDGVQLELALAAFALVVSGPALAMGGIGAAIAIAALPKPVSTQAPKSVAGGHSSGSESSSSGGGASGWNATGGTRIKLHKAA